MPKTWFSSKKVFALTILALFPANALINTVILTVPVSFFELPLQEVFRCTKGSVSAQVIKESSCYIQRMPRIRGILALYKFTFTSNSR